MRDTQKRPIYINRNIKLIKFLLFHIQVMCDLGCGCGAAALRIVYASNETYKRDIFTSKQIESLLSHTQVVCDLGCGCGAAALLIVYASNETYKRDLFTSKETSANRIPSLSHTGSVCSRMQVRRGSSADCICIK